MNTRGEIKLIGLSDGSVLHQDSINGNTHLSITLSVRCVVDKQLPQVEHIKAIHVYDFDNTCMCSTRYHIGRILRLIKDSVFIAFTE